MELIVEKGSLNRAISMSEIEVAVLAGGLGTRLRQVVSDRPKVLAEIHGRPFLAYLLDQLAAAGFRRVVLCTGYLWEKIYGTFGASYKSLHLFYSHEREPLGTAGGLRLALSRLQSDPVLVMNGDSYCAADLRPFFQWHCRRAARASLLLIRMAQPGRYGSVNVDNDGVVLEFREKSQKGANGWINAGVYLLSQAVLASIPQQRKVSLEYDVFPQWIGHGLCGYQTDGAFLDIGTPEDFLRADQFFSYIKRKFVVLDRDGTIIEECSYLSDPEQIKLIPGATQALRELREMGFGLVVITNQSGVGRGFFDEARLREIHERMRQMLEAEGAWLDGLYFCPHKPDDGCSCRKPGVSLMEKASMELGFDPQASIVIGDKACDIEMGRKVGALTFLVRTGYGAQFENTVAADFVVEDLLAASHSIGCLVVTERTDVHGH
jgi:D-glycero-alpha-D-manno-heptose 1-phosphate guanylyltransferase